MNAIQPVPSQALVDRNRFDELARMVEKTVATSSARVYRQTFDQWQAWASDNGLSPFDLHPANVTAYLESQDTTKATRQRQLSALRKLAEMLSILDYQNPQWTAIHGALKKVKVQRGGGHERERRALSESEVWELMRLYRGDTNLDLRNRALLAVMFYVGARRAEIAALKWTDINLEDAILHIAHGKGDRERDSTIVGDVAIGALLAWKERQGAREYVFCALDRGYRLMADKPMSANAIWKVVKQAEKLTGIPFTPHTARRTFATNALIHGSPIADVQAQLGHLREETTLRYTRPADAKARRFRLKTGY